MLHALMRAVSLRRPPRHRCRPRRPARRSRLRVSIVSRSVATSHLRPTLSSRVRSRRPHANEAADASDPTAAGTRISTAYSAALAQRCAPQARGAEDTTRLIHRVVCFSPVRLSDSGTIDRKFAPFPDFRGPRAADHVGWIGGVHQRASSRGWPHWCGAIRTWGSGNRLSDLISTDSPWRAGGNLPHNDGGPFRPGLALTLPATATRGVARRTCGPIERRRRGHASDYRHARIEPI